MKNVLIIWDDLPEEWNFLPLLVSDDQYSELLKWHDKYINAELNPYNDEMSKFFYTEDGEFKFKARITKSIQKANFDAILVMGFLL